MVKRSMIVVAGGSGTRMGSELPKQFMELNGKPILMHTLDSMFAFDPAMQLILVLPETQLNYWNELCKSQQWSTPHECAKGGNTRFQSVSNGLELAKGMHIGIHDGVRPFASHHTMRNCFAAAEQHGAAVPVVPIVQSLRKIVDGTNEAVNRDEYRAVQTPQCFNAEVLRDSFAKATKNDYSDDASVVEACGNKIMLIDGDSENIKITTPFDLVLARLIIERRLGKE